MIRFENVTYTYPFQTRPAVSDISFSVRPGELVLCTGASGCGKSTLMRLANGLCPHYFQGALEGRVLIGGEPTDARPINVIAREVGTLFQDPEQQFFALNVEDELAFAHEWQGVSPEDIAAKIDEAARAFRLGPILSSSIHELSEGQKQKVGLASILSQGPRALILDEPSANLDPEATEDLARKLAELKARGMAILVVDHRLYWLEGIADRVLVMREGRILLNGAVLACCMTTPCASGAGCAPPVWTIPAARCRTVRRNGWSRVKAGWPFRACGSRTPESRPCSTVWTCRFRRA